MSTVLKPMNNGQKQFATSSCKIFEENQCTRICNIIIIIILPPLIAEYKKQTKNVKLPSNI